ncbi:hypothetical protein GCM10023322_19440 [Rugosimonospora acidiphila]|uniref:Uncharacterized protein n=1 Tax=Rugosimonospora acidiphila TaxID=556531 RepID=A0ABP9RPH8_9ACTN
MPIAIPPVLSQWSRQPPDESPESDPGDQVAQRLPTETSIGHRVPMLVRRLVTGHDARTISVREEGMCTDPRRLTADGGIRHRGPVSPVRVTPYYSHASWPAHLANELRQRTPDRYLPFITPS